MQKGIHDERFLGCVSLAFIMRRFSKEVTILLQLSLLPYKSTTTKLVIITPKNLISSPQFSKRSTLHSSPGTNAHPTLFSHHPHPPYHYCPVSLPQHTHENGHHCHGLNITSSFLLSAKGGRPAASAVAEVVAAAMPEASNSPTSNSGGRIPWGNVNVLGICCGWCCICIG